MLNYNGNCEELRKMNSNDCTDLRNIQSSFESDKCCVSMDYEEAYSRLQHEFQELSNENKDLKKALVNIALKL